MVAGEVFNIGGGPSNALSVWTEFSQYLQELNGEPVSARFDDWRPGDQPCYVSDIQKAQACFGWYPVIDKETGIHRLHEWVASNLELFNNQVGDQRFFQILRTWAASHRNENATTAQFVALAQKVSGQDLDRFFRTWLWDESKPKTFG